MQSQQKRVKWSRGETAEALEERTDTGITQASVELMENCIPDIYGNISRRPAIVPIPVEDRYTDKKSTGDSFYYLFGFTYDEQIQFAVYYITQDDFIIIGLYPHKGPEFLRIQNGLVVARYDASDSNCYTGVQDISSNWTAQPISYAQQNNYLVLSTATNVWKIQLTEIQEFSFIPSIELWKFSAGWYAPEGTQTKQISATEVTGLSFDSSTFTNYTWTESDGSTTVGVSVSTGIAAASYPGTWTGDTTVFYCGFTSASEFIITTNSADLYRQIMTWTMTNGASYYSGQQLTSYSSSSMGSGENDEIRLYMNGNNAYFVGTRNWHAWSGSGIDTCEYNVLDQMEVDVPLIQTYIPNGSIVQFPNNGAFMRVEGYTSDGTNLIMYGALLAAVADGNTTDTNVNVEYNYVSLSPIEWTGTSTYPHPQKLAFNGQRLWAGGWAYSDTREYALVIGSQIARYNDLKNNYNQENEPVTLDILTQFKEKVLHLVDYNGLKVFTDAYEYAYNAVDGLVKQSSNGAYERCEPLVFESLCLYVDGTGKQVKAMQYELQSNIFNSSSINQLAPESLVYFPTSLAAFEDKSRHTGKYLFVLNGYEQGISTVRLSLCNFVPSNQANIWSRWLFPKLSSSAMAKSRLCGLVHTKTDPIFMLYARVTATSSGVGPETETLLSTQVIIPAKLTFTLPGGTVAIPDYATKPNANAQMVFASASKTDGPETTTFKTVLSNVDVAVYSNGEYQFTTHVNQLGYIEDDISQLTNVQVGYMINSRIVSHPIDVGGKTKSIKKRIGKAQMSVHNTDAGAITINGKTGYMNPAKDHICFYGVTGMKNEIKYTITNNNGAMFHLESLLMNIEYGTLIS